uniref:Arf-GAP domain-containing protein n=1 Tax=Fundulus heteroclitus TaxID=8078 RepID=A0A3Q2Q7Q8_FUNHE
NKVCYNRKNTLKLHHQVALRLWENPYNKVCGDCGAANPEWASVNLLLVICHSCAAQHRVLDRNLSKVRSLRMDNTTWTEPLIQVRANSINMWGTLIYPFSFLLFRNRSLSKMAKDLLSHRVVDVLKSVIKFHQDPGNLIKWRNWISLVFLSVIWLQCFESIGRLPFGSDGFPPLISKDDETSQTKHRSSFRKAVNPLDAPSAQS